MAAKHLLLGNGMIETGVVRCACTCRACRIPDVPWNHAVELVSQLLRGDVVMTRGQRRRDHRLSRPEVPERFDINPSGYSAIPSS